MAIMQEKQQKTVFEIEWPIMTTVFDSLATQPSSNQKLIAESPSSTRMARAENAHILEYATAP